nr:MAG TPA: hypothetical protein [Caudoviricetes sp.]
MFYSNADNLPRQRKKKEDKAIKANAFDTTEITTALMASLSDLTEQIVTLTEQNASLAEQVAALTAASTSTK